MGPKPWRKTTQLALLALGLGVAVTAGEERGTVKSVDETQKRVVLDSGTQLWLMPGLSFDLFTQGKRVKVVYDEREGKKWVRSVEATD
jgi:hypothetical protein